MQCLPVLTFFAYCIYFWPSIFSSCRTQSFKTDTFASWYVYAKTRNEVLIIYISIMNHERQFYIKSNNYPPNTVVCVVYICKYMCMSYNIHACVAQYTCMCHTICMCCIIYMHVLHNIHAWAANIHPWAVQYACMLCSIHIYALCIHTWFLSAK